MTDFRLETLDLILVPLYLVFIVWPLYVLLNMQNRVE